MWPCVARAVSEAVQYPIVAAVKAHRAEDNRYYSWAPHGGQGGRSGRPRIEARSNHGVRMCRGPALAGQGGDRAVDDAAVPA